MRLAAIVVIFFAGIAVVADPPAWNPDRFPIGFWCGPPDNFVTPERFKQIADAGFTFTFPACSGGSANPDTNRKILDAAQATGLKVFVHDYRVPTAIGKNAKAKESLDAIVAAYAHHPATAGYFITDEPGKEAFAGLGEVVEYLRMKDPAHVGFINLLPNYGVGAGYDDYVESFATTVKPFAVSYDHYHFRTSGDRPEFFPNLETVRKISLKHGLPFWNIVLGVQHLDYRSLTEAEKRFEAMQTLAYGGKGLLWFTYWQPGKDWGEAIIQLDGTPTRQYAEVKRINADVQAVGKHLLRATSTAVLTKGSAAGVPVDVIDGPVTVGVFTAGDDHFAFVASRDYKNAATTRLKIAAAGRPVKKLDKATSKWLDAHTEPASVGDTNVSVHLAPGDGELFRW